MIGTILGAAASGGITGLVGTIVQGFAAGRARANERKHELATRKLDQAEMRLEHQLALEAAKLKIDGQIRVAKTEQETAVISADAKTQVASYKHDQARYGGGRVDAIRGLMRPLITAYTLLLLSLIAWLLYGLSTELGNAALNITLVMALLEQVVGCIIYLTTTSVTWWFGSRPQRKATAKATA